MSMNEEKNNQKTIGVVMEDVFTDFAKEILHSVVHAVLGRKDVRLVVVSGRQDESTDETDSVHRYRQIYNSIYRINGKCEFDGLIFTLPNFRGVPDDMFRGIPKVYIACEKPGELTVNYDNERGIREALEYLIKIKGISKICMIGGREDNGDAMLRKRIFQKCLEDNGIPYSESLYETADMSKNTQGPAARLLARNPDVQAVFCVNDPTAVGLYDVMRSKGLVPGKDILVFGFDNASLASEMIPPLASIGTDGITLGQKALEILLEKIAGREAESVTVPTRLFGRESFEYEMFDVTVRDMVAGGEAFIYGFFDNCFYRYRNEIVDPRDINLRRLFYEILSRMLQTVKDRYMSEEQFHEICRMIDILFSNGVMRYTDPSRFIRSLSSLQGSINESRRGGYVNMRNNRLFAYMKDRAIMAQDFRHSMETRNYNAGRSRIYDFTVQTVNYGKPGEEALENLIERFDLAGFPNGALYLYEKPVRYTMQDPDVIPETLNLRCVVRGGALYVIPKERQECTADKIYSRSELPHEHMGYISYPLFYGEYLFGVLVTGISRGVIDNGEYVTTQLSRMIYLNWGIEA